MSPEGGSESDGTHETSHCPSSGPVPHRSGSVSRGSEGGACLGRKTQGRGGTEVRRVEDGQTPTEEGEFPIHSPFTFSSDKTPTPNVGPTPTSQYDPSALKDCKDGDERWGHTSVRNG